MRRPIYLDYNATTPVDERVLARMLPYFTEHFGNASSKGHAYGWAADEAVTQAREQVADALGATPEEIVFTGGATEALNIAIRGAAHAYRRKGNHLITVATEHKATLDTCRALERDGFTTTVLPVDADGRLDPAALADAMPEATTLVAVMWANNETGVIQPIEALSEIAHAHGALFLTDATQALGKVPVSVQHVDLLACSGHKCYGPKGVGALYVRRRTRLVPVITGGKQEDGRRAGTLNTPGIVGLGAAAAVAMPDLDAEAERLARLRDRLEARLIEALPDAHVNGRGAPRLPNTCNITLPGAAAKQMMAALRGLAVSSGSACSSGKGTPSHVLTAHGLSADAARSSLRLSLGRFTTAAEVDTATDEIIAAATQLRATAVAE